MEYHTRRRNVYYNDDEYAGGYGYHRPDYNYHLDNTPYRYLNGYSLPAGYRPASETLYGDGLVSLCQENRANLHHLRKTLTKVDPCYQFGVEHWHFSKDKPAPQDDLPEHMRPKWSSPDNMFTSGVAMARTNWKSPPAEDDRIEPPGPVNKFCYLCTTLDEHMQHLARRGLQLKAKKKVRPRVEFVVPLPGSTVKKEKEDEKQETLYKVTVKTGNKPNAATGANVFIKLIGDEGTMRERQLQKKTCVNFTFGRNTKETFYLKTPTLGRLQALVIRHDGLEKKHAWYLEEVEVLDVSARQIYVFVCRQWLSLHHGDHRVKLQLRAHMLETFQREYIISVTTGKKTLAGTDAMVTLTLIGKLGSSPKLKLKRKTKDHETLQRGATDKFNFVTDDIGSLQKIRIEHDNTGKSPDWYLEKVQIEESEDAYLFPCGRWIPADDEQDRQKVSLELYPVKNMLALKKLMKPEKKAVESLLDYHVTVLTGDVRDAGTDANVYLVIFGKNGTSRELLLDNEKNNFERGMTDEFKVKAEDVGKVKKIRIRHDNTSLAAGWFLDNIVLRRFFTKDEVREKLAAEGVEEDEKALRRASTITGLPIQGRDVDKADKRRHKGGRAKRGAESSEDDSEEEEDEEEQMGRRRKDRKSKSSGKSGGRKNKYKSSGSSDSESDSESDTDSDDRLRRGSKGRKSKRDVSKGIKKRGKGHTKKRDSSEDSSDEDEKGRRKKSKSSGKSSRRKNKYLDSDSSQSTSESDSESDLDKKLRRDGRKKKKSKHDTDKVNARRRRSHSQRRFDDSSDKEEEEPRWRTKDKSSKSSRKSFGRKNKYGDSDDSHSTSDSDSDTESDSDEKTSRRDGKKKKNKKDKKDKKGEWGRRKVGEESDSEAGTDDYKGKVYARWARDRIPYCDEYLFVCQRWLATDEDDRKIERELKPVSVTTFYRKGEKVERR